MNGFIQLVQAFPISGRNTTVNRFVPVECGIPARNEIAMPVGDIALVIGKDRVVRSVRQQLHILFERFKPVCLSSLIRLYQRIQRPVNRLYAHPFSVAAAHNTGRVACAR